MPELGGEKRALIVGRAVAGAAVDQIEQQHRVPRPRPQEVDLRGRELGTEIHVRLMRVIIELEVIDDVSIRVELGQEERRPESAVADDHVGAKLGMRLASLKHGVRVPDAVLKRPAAIMRVFPGPAANLVLDLANSRDLARGRLRHERARPPALLHEVAGDMAELGREILVNEQDVHLK